jgi:hypothetical protein
VSDRNGSRRLVVGGAVVAWRDGTRTAIASLAHTLRMSAALLAAGRPHQVLPLSSMTHDTPADADTFSQLLRHELAFLAESLGVRIIRNRSGAESAVHGTAGSGDGCHSRLISP